MSVDGYDDPDQASNVLCTVKDIEYTMGSENEARLESWAVQSAFDKRQGNVFTSRTIHGKLHSLA
jgi:hypothetical protein